MNAQDQQNSDRIVRNIDYLQVLKNRWKEVFLVSFWCWSFPW